MLIRVDCQTTDRARLLVSFFSAVCGQRTNTMDMLTWPRDVVASRTYRRRLRWFTDVAVPCPFLPKSTVKSDQALENPDTVPASCGDTYGEARCEQEASCQLLLVLRGSSMRGSRNGWRVASFCQEHYPRRARDTGSTSAAESSLSDEGRKKERKRSTWDEWTPRGPPLCIGCHISDNGIGVVTAPFTSHHL